MEILGLAIAFPAVLIANLTYALLVRLSLSRIQNFKRWIIWLSSAVLAMLVIDIFLVSTIGPVHTRAFLGASYWALHLLIVSLGAPALTNILLIRGGSRWYHQWYFAAGIGFVLGMFLVFFMVGVGDVLFGPDGIGGQYS
jgi:hypothetical protein